MLVLARGTNATDWAPRWLRSQTRRVFELAQSSLRDWVLSEGAKPDSGASACGQSVEWRGAVEAGSSGGHRPYAHTHDGGALMRKV